MVWCRIGMADILVGIGDFKISNAPNILKTNLGSCVGLTLYNPHKKIGGLLHVLLPRAPKNKGENLSKYADTGFEQFLKELKKKGCDISKLEAKVFGGAHVIKAIKTRVGDENLAVIKEMLKKNRIRIKAERTGGDRGYLIWLDLSTGKVTCRVFGEVERIY